MIPTFRQNPSMHHPSQHMPLERPGISDPLIDFGGLPIPQRFLDCFALKQLEKTVANVVVTVVVENLQLCMYARLVRIQLLVVPWFCWQPRTCRCFDRAWHCNAIAHSAFGHAEVSQGSLVLYFFYNEGGKDLVKFHGQFWWSLMASFGWFSLWFYTCFMFFLPPMRGTIPIWGAWFSDGFEITDQITTDLALHSDGWMVGMSFHNCHSVRPVGSKNTT